MTAAVAALLADGATAIRDVYNWRVKETERMKVRRGWAPAPSASLGVGVGPGGVPAPSVSLGVCAGGAELDASE